MGIRESMNVCVCMPACAPAGLPLHIYACVCGFVNCVRVGAHTQARGETKRRDHLRALMD